MTVLPETDVLSAVDPKLHPDDWPIHHLKKINVISQQTQQSVSLLESHKDHAVQVTGILDAVDSPQGQKIPEGKWRNKRIEISNVSFWAFSEEEPDRSICLWASGKAGWFELHDPVPQYQDIFSGMNEAVSMLYHLADKYRRSRKNHSNITIKDMNKLVRSAFHDYRAPGKHQRQFEPAAAVDRFHSHARFLITSMLEGQDNQDWSNSLMLRYYKHHFENIYEEVEARLYPQRQSKLAKTKPQIVQSNNQRKQASTGRILDKSSRQVTTGRSTRRRPAPEIPRTPKQPRIPNGDTDTSGDEEYDSSGMVIEAGTKRKSRSILQPKGSKFSKKAASRRQNPDSVADEPGYATSDQDDKVAPPEVSPLAAVSQREPPPQYHPPRNTIELEMVVCDIPSDQPQGPGDLWTCQFENCNQRVHEASKPKGKAQIKSHFQEHARRAQEKIDLALAESRPYLPVR
ncbi:MAG: hypothetical protein L6R42_002860 [Xanthoria sp. 1 TBL-2021]|nr:MAG: hypothetical protein L6R42_002860 [Xanthoria sp. 1 TBL-2021]